MEATIKVGMKFIVKGDKTKTIFTIYIVGLRLIWVNWPSDAEGVDYSVREAIYNIDQGDWILLT